MGSSDRVAGVDDDLELNREGIRPMNKLITALITTVLALSAQVARAADFYVAPTGRDDDLGTKDQPLATLGAARDAARTVGTGPHRILVMPGDYFLARTLELDARDNGLTIETVGAGKATLYDGRLVEGWRPDGQRFWCADVPGVKEGAWDFRALVVNERMPLRRGERCAVRWDQTPPRLHLGPR